MQAVKPSDDAMSALKGTHITVVTYGKSPFTAMTYGKAMLGGLGGAVGGAIGGGIALSEGNKIIRDNDVPDPAVAIAAKLSPLLATRLSASGVDTITDHDPDANSEKVLVGIASGKGAVLDVQTLWWEFIYFPLDWSHYHILYSARARLLDAASGQVIAQAPCKFDTENDTPRPDYDTMLADKAAKLKAMLAEAETACTASMEKDLFGTDAPAAAP
jgi:hypothetical protein